MRSLFRIHPPTTHRGHPGRAPWRFVAVMAALVAALVAVLPVQAADRPASARSPVTTPAPTPAEAALKRTIEERMPGVRIVGLARTPYAGLYEVRTEDNEIFYTDEKASFLFVGAIRDGRDPQRNLTEERQQALSAIAFSELPFDGAFRIVRGNGKRQLAYFSDPNCPYCKQLEKELLQLNDVTVHVFLYPILSADSMPKSRSIWCSSDKGKAWLDWMVGGVAPTTAGICDSQAIERNLAFGRRARVTSVPTLVYSNGSRHQPVDRRGGAPAAVIVSGDARS